MTEELKQAARQALMECPFCGSEPHDAHHIEYGRWAVTCRCGAKGASANTGPNATDAAKIKAYSDARTAWNTRALTQRPAAQEGEVDIKSRVSELIAEHGTLRAAARSLNIDVGYLSRLEHGDKVHPSSETLAKIGLRDAGVKYQRLVFLPTQPAAQADSMGMPTSCGKPLCSPDEHHPLCKLHQPAAQAMPEPVGDVRCEGCGYMTHHREHMGCVRAAKQNTHTHAAQPVPMTDAEMFAAIRPLCMDDMTAHGLVKTSADEYRAIEAHHGITAQAKGGDHG